MSENNNSEKSVESLTLEHMLTSQTTQINGQRISRLKLETNQDNSNNIYKQNSESHDISDNMSKSCKQIISFSDKKYEKMKEENNMIKSFSPSKKMIKKKKLLLELMEKNKKSNFSKKVPVSMQDIKLKDENTKNDKIRKDAYGIPINSRNKKRIKVTFTDTINNDNNNLVEIIDIPSFKQYNYIEGLPKEERVDNKATCKCCIIF